MKDTGAILLGSVAATLGILGLILALYELTIPLAPEKLPTILGGLLAYTVGWAISLWTFTR
jgi:hypothetical protein